MSKYIFRLCPSVSIIYDYAQMYMLDRAFEIYEVNHCQYSLILKCRIHSQFVSVFKIIADGFRSIIRRV